MECKICGKKIDKYYAKIDMGFGRITAYVCSKKCYSAFNNKKGAEDE